MSPPMLTVRQQICLIRIARVRLVQLQEEYESLIARRDMSSTRYFLIEEIECVEQGIRWLWLQHLDPRHE